MVLIKNDYKVNKLIIIGNGLDLALGLKTDYKNFLSWYLKSVFEKSFKSLKQSVDKNSYISKYHLFDDDLVSIYSRNFYHEDDLLRLQNILKSLSDFKKLTENRDEFILEPKSHLFNAIYTRSIDNWVDIESIYFELLKDCFKSDKEGIIKLNTDFKIIRNLLEVYLTSIEFNENSFKSERNNFIGHFFDAINKEELLDLNSEDVISMNKTYFLNFNYTDALSKLIKGHTFKHFIDFEIYHIHGKINSETEPIIFGFGDEMTEDYKKIEEFNNNSFFENIKSFKYSLNGNYRKLLSFLNSNYYQVCIYGHSCGLSDRVMLNEIFEHENCKSIKIYFYEYEDGSNGNDFSNKNMDISRHFNSNKLMRQKIVEFNSQNKIPQIKN